MDISTADKLRPTVLGLPSEPASLRQRRERAWQRVVDNGLPGAKDENWKYSSLKLLQRREFEFDHDRDRPVISGDWLDRQLSGLPSGPRWVFVDGRPDPALSNLVALPETVQVDTPAGDDRAAVDDTQDFFVSDNARDDAFAGLALAAAAEPVRLRVSADAHLDAPLILVHVGSEGQGAHWRAELALEAGAKAQIIEIFLSASDKPSFLNSAVRSLLAPNARLDWTRIQKTGSQALLVSRMDIRQQRGSELAYFGLDGGGQWVRHDINVALQQASATASLNGVFIVDGKRHVDNHTRIDHRAPNCRSSENFSGIAAGRGRGVFNGKVIVQPGADGTDAAQSSGNLLLSPHAEIDTKPELEIYADDVSASHGATVGQLDREALFYLRTRGLAEADARQMLLQAFCRQAFDKMPEPGLRDALNHQLDFSLARLL